MGLVDQSRKEELILGKLLFMLQGINTYYLSYIFFKYIEYIKYIYLTYI